MERLLTGHHDHGLRERPADRDLRRRLRGELRIVQRSGSIGDEQAPIEGLLPQIDIARPGNQPLVCLHVELLARNMAGTEAAFGNELVERGDIFHAPALALERAGKEAGEIDGDGASARLQPEWPREPARKLVIGAARGGEIHLEVAYAIERSMESKRAEAGLDRYVRQLPRELRLVDGL